MPDAQDLWVILFTFVFKPCGLSSAEMPLGLVLFQNVFCLYVKGGMQPLQPFCEILVYGGFADAELFRCGADCGSVFNDVQGQLHGPLLDIGFHIYHSKTYF